MVDLGFCKMILWLMQKRYLRLLQKRYLRLLQKDFVTFAQRLCDLFVSALVVTAALASLWAADRFAIIKRLSDYHIIIIVSMTIKTIFLFLQTGHGSRKAGRTLCSSWTFHWDTRRRDGPGGGITISIMFFAMRILGYSYFQKMRLSGYEDVSTRLGAKQTEDKLMIKVKITILMWLTRKNEAWIRLVTNHW